MHVLWCKVFDAPLHKGFVWRISHHNKPLRNGTHELYLVEQGQNALPTADKGKPTDQDQIPATDSVRHIKR
jgi:hypothetical protein